jgi:bacteriorhodopsin
LLGVGVLLSAGVVTVETLDFYEPTVFMNWLRIIAVFAVFCGIGVVSVDVITNHLNQSLKDQAELIENLRGAMQLRDAAEIQRRNAEKRLRDSQQMPKV